MPSALQTSNSNHVSCLYNTTYFKNQCSLDFNNLNKKKKRFCYYLIVDLKNDLNQINLDRNYVKGKTKYDNMYVECLVYLHCI